MRKSKLADILGNISARGKWISHGLPSSADHPENDQLHWLQSPLRGQEKWKTIVYIFLIFHTFWVVILQAITKMFSLSISVTSVEIYAIGICALWAAYTVIYRLFFHPLARVPGPKFAAATWLYQTYFSFVGGSRYYIQIEKLHQIYGSITHMFPDQRTLLISRQVRSLE